MDYSRNAKLYAEKYGVIEYRVKGRYMIYNKSYPATSCEPRRTYQHKVDLVTGISTVTLLKRFDGKGYYNV